MTVSVLLRPGLPTDRLGWVPLLGGLAVARALRDLGAPAVLKWPNDVLLPARDDLPGWGRRRKVAGVLADLLPGRDAARPSCSAIGINVAQTEAELPVPSATSLALAGVVADRVDVLVGLLARLLEADVSWRASRGDADRRRARAGVDRRGGHSGRRRGDRPAGGTHPRGTRHRPRAGRRAARRGRRSRHGRARRRRATAGLTATAGVSLAGWTTGAPRRSEPRVAATLAELDDLLLGGPRTLTLAGVASAAGVSVREAAGFWLALGLRLPDPDEEAFTVADAAVIGGFVGAGREFGLSRDAGVSLVRAIGHSIDRLVTWQSETIVEHLATKYDLPDAQARLLLVERLPIIDRAARARAGARLEAPPLSGGRSRGRHGGGGAVRAGRRRAAARAGGGPCRRRGFTARTADLGAAAFADYIQGFESQARDVVTLHGGRVVKTVGDALLFVADDLPTGARVALGLVRAFGTTSAAPLRIGLVWGRVLSRFGDVFGPSVALASRLCDEAGPGRVLVDEATVAELQGFRTEPLSAREVPGWASCTRTGSSPRGDRGLQRGGRSPSHAGR